MYSYTMAPLMVLYWTHWCHVITSHSLFHIQQYVTQQYVTQQYVTQQYVTQQYVTQQYVIQQYVTKQYVTQQYVTQQYVTQQYVTQQYVTQQYVTHGCSYLDMFYHTLNLAPLTLFIKLRPTSVYVQLVNGCL